jgi:hypothetical protein
MIHNQEGEYDMKKTENMSLKIGDWVKGRTHDGELIQGYLEDVNNIQGFAKVKVIECDNKFRRGKTIEVLDHWIEKIPESSEITEEYINMLIDLALLTKDEEWFMDLSKIYKSFKSSQQLKDDLFYLFN